MSLPSTIARLAVTITSFPQTIPVFEFDQPADLIVYDGGSSNTGHSPAVVLVLGSDYTVTGGGYNSLQQLQPGSITVNSGGAGSVQTGDVITILRSIPLVQDISLQSTGPLTINEIEAALDNLTAISQQQEEAIESSVRYRPEEGLDGLLAPANIRALTLLGFDAAGFQQYVTATSLTGVSALAGVNGAISLTTAAGISSIGFATVQTVASLKALSVVNAGWVQVLGYYSASDGGGGVFWYNSASSATDNGGTIIQPTVGTGRWIRIYSGSVSVKWFGAKGDFSNDDSVPINKAVAWLASLGGGSLYFPATPNAYGISASAIQISSNIRYFGDAGSSTIKSLASSTDSVMSVGATTGSATGVEIDHLVIDGNKANCAYNTRGGGGVTDDAWQIGIRLFNVSNCRIHDCTIQNTVMDGISIYSGTSTWIQENLITAIGKGGAVTGSASYNGVIYEGDCKVSWCTGNSINATLSSGIFYDLGATYSYNDIFCHSNIIATTADQAVFVFINPGATATVFNRISIKDNLVSACGITLTDPAIEVSNETATLVITGLEIIGNQIFASYGGISVGAGGTTPNTVISPIVSGNIAVNSTTTSGFALTAECAKVIFTNNTSTGNGSNDVMNGSYAVWNSNNQDNPPMSSITAGAGAGTSPTIAVTSISDTQGKIAVTTGSSPSTSAIIATITLAVKHLNAPTAVSLTPANAATQSLAVGAQAYVVSTSTTGFIIESQGSALAGATAYAWYFTIPQ